MLTDVHRLLYDTLSGNGDLMEIVTGIFDDPPDDQAGPYIVLGDLHAVPGRMLDGNEAETFLRLHIWSSYKGRKEVLLVAQLTRAALFERDFLFEDLTVARDDESEWWHGTVVFRIFDRR